MPSPEREPRRRGLSLVAVLVAASWAPAPRCQAAGPPWPRATADRSRLSADQAELLAQLKQTRAKVLFETYRDGNWDLFAVNADGSNPVNLTRTPKVDELYPHGSPDGARICFVADEGAGKARSRNVYYMNADGTGRTLVARNAREPCWGPDGRAIAYLHGEYDRFTLKDYATKGLVIYDLKTRKHRPHPNKKLHHLYNICWSPCGRWFVATVHGGMGYKHAILAIEADGLGVFNLKPVGGCRPDISPDGKRIAWNPNDHALGMADLDLTASPPKVANVRHAVTCNKTHEVYHVDWSPDGRHLAFSYGPKGGEQMGQIAKGWQIGVVDASRKNLALILTSGGLSTKEADWLPARRSAGGKQAALRATAARMPERIVFQRYVNDNWELFLARADGTDPVNLTNTRYAHEHYPHASPDGSKICFSADEGRGRLRSRNVYVMNVNGTGRTLVARNARQPCWSPDGKTIAYTPGEYSRFTLKCYASKGISFYDLATRKTRRHPNRSIHHIYALCWAPGGRWIFATVYGGMGYKEANLAIEVAGTAVHCLSPPVVGCRPDFSPDGKKLAWNLTDQVICVADVDLTSSRPLVRNVRKVLTCDKKHEVYQADWSPDGRFLLFAHGPLGGQTVGYMAKDWQIGLADPTGTNVRITLTNGGVSHKDPDWVPARRGEGR